MSLPLPLAFQRLNRNDFIFVAASTINIAVCLLLLFRFSGDPATLGRSEAIGEVFVRNREAKRKLAARAVWNRLESAATLYNHDTLRTAELSAATVELKDGTRIDIGENSLVVLRFEDDGVELQLKRGDLSVFQKDAARPALPITVLTARGRVSLHESDARVRQAKNGDLKLSVTRGSARLDAGEESHRVEANRQLELERDRPPVPGQAGRMRVVTRELAFTWQSPDADAEFRAGPGGRAQVAFAWQTPAEAEGSLFELARDPFFRRMITSRRLNVSRHVPALPPGSYYARVRNGTGVARPAASPTRRIFVREKRSLRLFTPLPDAVFRTTAAAHSVFFGWEAAGGAGFRLEIARDRDFGEETARIDVLSSNIAHRLPPGRYFWRVIGTGRSRQGADPSNDRSEIRSFTVKSARAAAAPGPLPLYPARYRNVSAARFGKDGVLFTWTSVPTRSYELEIARDANFTRRVLSQRAAKNFSMISGDFAPGAYFWRVRDASAATEFSPPAVFVAQRATVDRLESRARITYNPGSDRESAVASWKNAGPDREYRVELARDPDFSKRLVDERTRDSVKRFDGLRDGKFFWRVSLLSAEGQPVTVSRTQSFEILGALEPPEIEYPVHTTTVDMTGRKNLPLRWKRVPNAGFYTIRLFQTGPGKRRRVLVRRTRTPGFTLDELKRLDSGDFRLEVSAAVRGRETPVAASNFRIALKKLATPNIKTPREVIIRAGDDRPE